MSKYLISLEGGGTRSQAVLMDYDGNVLATQNSTDVNTNFVAYDQAQLAVQTAAHQVLQAGGVQGKDVTLFVSALVGPDFGAETFGKLCANAVYNYYDERDVVFARAGLFRPHGIALVIATGATTWGVRADDGRQAAFGGWGSLLGDEGSAYAMGLLGLRAAVRAFEGRAGVTTRLVDAVCEYFQLTPETFHRGLIHIAYQKPLSRVEIASVAPVVTKLAIDGDALATQIVAKVARDAAALALHAARQLFTPQEAFDLAVAGGLVDAGDLILSPLREGLGREFPKAALRIGTEAPAVALGRLALFNYSIRRNHAHRTVFSSLAGQDQ